MDDLSKRESTMVDQSTGSSKKDKKRASGSPSPGRTPKNKSNSTRKSALSEDAFTTFDTPQNIQFTTIEQGSKATKIGCSSSNMRKDFYGNLISKGPNKKQKLSWADKVEDISVPTVITVESYKKYNVDVSADRADCSCACYIF